MWPPYNCPSAWDSGDWKVGTWCGGGCSRGGRRHPPPDVRLHVTHTGLCCLQSASQCHLCVASGGIL